MNYELTELAPEHHSRATEIFNHYVATGTAAYPQTPVPAEAIAKLVASNAGYPAVVALTPGREVAGFGMLRPWHPLPTFRRTAEVTYFLAPERTRGGAGTAMLDWLCARAAALGITSILASISSENEASLAFHRKHGFVECGRFVEVGAKQGRTFDVIWMQRRLS